MNFGYFDDQRREYVITTPTTPHPWINYLGSESFFSIISHQAAGYCFYRDARFRRLLRYRYNGVPDLGGRYFYLRVGADVWTPSFLPMKRVLAAFECRHGLGYTKITARRNDVEASQLHFVPLGTNAEVCELTLTNRGEGAKVVTVFSFLEWCLWNALDDATNHQRNLSTGEIEVERSGQTIYHKTEYRERRDHFAFSHVNAPVVGFDTDRESFVGLWNNLAEPQVPVEGWARNSVATGWSPIASHQVAVPLAPGETRRLMFLIGYIENPPDQKWAAPGVIRKDRAHALIEALASPGQVQEKLAELAEYWSERLGTFQLVSADPRLDRMVNVWNQYQCLVTFNLARSASSFETGIGRGIGFRDSNQDLLGVVQTVPRRARQRILDLAATQRPDGSAWHQYQPLTRKGNDAIGSGFNDDPLWLILAVDAYLRETGDVSSLTERVAFDGEVDPEATLFDHLTRSLTHVTCNRGPHGLPLIGRADWNDCLNLNCFSSSPDESFQTTENQAGGVAESVFIAGLFAYAAPLYAQMARLIGREKEGRWAERACAEMWAAVSAHGRDDHWFLRAYDARGNKVGAISCTDGQIFIEPQGFCVMAGMGVDDGFARRALDAVKQRLDTPYGIVLQQPAFRSYRLELGEISSYPPGYKENAGVFCHNNPWVMIAETVIGRGDQAFSYWKKITPAYLEERSEIHRTEPYVYAQMIAGRDAARPGEAKNSWLTGTAAWSFVALTQHILGIRPEHEGLRVSPCLPREIEHFTARRLCRGAIYEITVKNTGRGGGARLRVNGRDIEGAVVPYAPAGAKVSVECES